MNAFAHFPSRLHWTAQELADAVPLRLHEMFAFDAACSGDRRAAANGDRRPAPVAGGYLARTALPRRFSVH